MFIRFCRYRLETRKLLLKMITREELTNVWEGHRNCRLENFFFSSLEKGHFVFFKDKMYIARRETSKLVPSSSCFSFSFFSLFILLYFFFLYTEAPAIVCNNVFFVFVTMNERPLDSKTIWWKSSNGIRWF